jgi:hypothetical protein
MNLEKHRNYTDTTHELHRNKKNYNRKKYLLNYNAYYE